MSCSEKEKFTEFQVAIPSHESRRRRWRRCAVDTWTKLFEVLFSEGLLQMVKSLAPFPFLFNLNIKSLKKHAFYFNEIPPHENVNCYFLDRTANHREVPSFHLRGKPLLPKRVGQSPPQSENQGRHSCSWRWSRTPPETPTSLTSGWILLEAENGLVELRTNPQIWEF